jgi:UDP-N-acetylglucosamine 2-epimerase (non-hydrolysing)
MESDAESPLPKVLTLFGTRPELIKLAPVMAALDADPELQTLQISSTQHRDLLQPFLELFETRVDAELSVMRPGQPLNLTAARVLEAFDAVLEAEKPDLVVVQGDTTTAFAGALAAFQRGISVAHVEAGLRTDDLKHPFPEEMNRRLVGRLADLHLAATETNRDRLLAEGIAPEAIRVTGNPVIDALHAVRRRDAVTPATRALLESLRGRRLIALTAHRRESQGEALEALLRTLADFVAARDDLALVYPVHPNPRVREAADRVLARREGDRIHLIEPLGYADFLALVEAAWLLVSDSGGVQEEAPSLGTPLLVLRETTERPEAASAGVARLIGLDPAALDRELREAERPGSWIERVGEVPNPFGDGRAAERIHDALRRHLGLAASSSE